MNWGTLGTLGGAGLGWALGGPVGGALGAGLGGYLGRELGGGTKIPGAADAANVRAALGGAAAGTVPSAAEELLRRERERAMGTQLSLARSIPGLAPAAQARMAALGAANAQQQIASQTAALRADEQARAREALARFTLGQQGINLQQQGIDQNQLQMLLRGLGGYAGGEAQGQMAALGGPGGGP